MWKKICSLGILQMLLVLSCAQDNCDYFQYMEKRESYSIFNPYYPKEYSGENHCRWITTSNSLIEGNCSFSLPYSDKCTEDAVTMKYKNKTSIRYCGFKTIDFQESNILQIRFDSLANSIGGRFSCDIRIPDPDNEDNNRDSCKCGRINRERIVGGSTTGINEYPMMAGLVNAINDIIYCGATIINNCQVITAASCLSNINWNIVAIIVGEHDITTERETNATKLYGISNVFFPPYPQYNNIAIVNVHGTIEFNNAVGSVCLPFQHAADTFAGQYADVLGWGLVGFREKKATSLERVEMSVMTRKDCNRYYFGIQNYQMCIHTLTKDVCEFDSGGPVLWRNPATKRMLLIAVIGDNLTCGNGFPAISTRIGVFMNWILSITPPEVKYCIEE